MELIGKNSNELWNPYKIPFTKNNSTRKVPFVLLTNGGGVTEEEKAEQISEIVGVRVLFFLFTRQQNTLIFSRLTQKPLFYLTRLCKTSWVNIKTNECLLLAEQDENALKLPKSKEKYKFKQNL